MTKIQFGGRLLDLTNPNPEHVDWSLIRPRLGHIRRFGNDPNALTVRQHTRLVALLFEETLRQGDLTLPAERVNRVRDWCLHHDNHEAIIGDILAPVKAYLSQADGGEALRTLEWALDEAIHGAADLADEPYYLPAPDDRFVRDMVHHFDRMAAAFEWRFVMHKPLQSWNVAVPSHICQDQNYILRMLYNQDGGSE